MNDTDLDEEGASVADLIEAASQPVVKVAAPAPNAPSPLVRSEIIPAEYWPAPVEEAVKIAQQPTPILANLPLFDRVIAEFYPPAKMAKMPVLVARASGLCPHA